MDDDAPPGVPEWVVTYGDMMSLLLTFFIMLVSMSEQKESGRVRSMLDALQQQFGADDVLSSGVPGSSLQTSSMFPVQQSAGMRSEGGVKKASRNDPGVRGASDPVQRLRDGQRITLGGPAIFPAFSAEPSDSFAAVMDNLAHVVSGSQRQIAVRGHASPRPLPGEVVAAGVHPTHDELAFARAMRVAEALESRGVPSGRLVLSSAGAREPRIKTRDPNEQRQNDRVDVFLLNDYSTGP